MRDPTHLLSAFSTIKQIELGALHSGRVILFSSLEMDESRKKQVSDGLILKPLVFETHFPPASSPA